MNPDGRVFKPVRRVHFKVRLELGAVDDKILVFCFYLTFTLPVKLSLKRHLNEGAQSFCNEVLKYEPLNTGKKRCKQVIH